MYHLRSVRLGADVLDGGAGDTSSGGGDWITALGRIVGIAGAAAVVGKQVFGKPAPLAPPTPYFQARPTSAFLPPPTVPITQQGWFWPVLIGGVSLGALLLLRK